MLLDVDIITYFCCMLICSLDNVVEWCMLFVDTIFLHWNIGLLKNAQVCGWLSLQ